MSTTNENFSAQDSMHLISSMIYKAKNQFSENGHLYLLWGWTIFFCSVAQFINSEFYFIKNAGWIWTLTWVAIIYQVIFLVKREKKERVKTYTEEINNYIWVVFGIMMFLLTIIVSKYEAWYIMYALILAMYGVPTFLSGIIFRFNALKIGGIACWILAVVSIFIPAKFVILCLSLAVIIAWIILGYLLQQKYKKQNF
jgi:hypothetical protein